MIWSTDSSSASAGSIASENSMTGKSRINVRSFSITHEGVGANADCLWGGPTACAGPVAPLFLEYRGLSEEKGQPMQNSQPAAAS